MKKILPIVTALLVGLGLGYLLFGRRHQGSGGHLAGRGSGDDPQQRSGSLEDSNMDRRRGGPAMASRTLTTRALLQNVRQRNLQLVQENKRLADRLGNLEQDLVFARGKPMPWPTQTPSRFSRKAVTQAVNQALRQAGLKGEVTDVDCKEYPCVMSGSLQGRVSPSQLLKVLSTRALRPYNRDHAQTSITNRTGHDSEGRRWQRSHFAIAIQLGGPAGTQPDVKRTVHRLRQLLDTTTGQ